MVDSTELVELAAHLCGIDIEETEDEEDIWLSLWEKYEIDEENFTLLISDLLPLVQMGESLLLKKITKGFGTVDKNGIIDMFVKVNATN